MMNNNVDKNAQYDDCYDDYATQSTHQDYGATEIKIYCQEQFLSTAVTSGVIDDVALGYGAASEAGITAIQKRCLGLGDTASKFDNQYGYGGQGTTNSSHKGSTDDNHISKAHVVTLSYQVKDMFGNPSAIRNRTVSITDNIAPTLYITQSQIRTNGYTNVADAYGKKGTTCEGDNCKCIQSNGTDVSDATAASPKDFTTASCVQNHHTDANGVTYATRDHTFATDQDIGSGGSGVSEHDGVDGDNSAYTNELQIQHSAGYAEDYRYIQELMVEGAGFGCYDICSSTTTTVHWHNSACATKCDTGDVDPDGNKIYATSESGDHVCHNENGVFNMLLPGTYYLKYTCSDKSDNLATACRTFLNVDKTRPVITVLQAANNAEGTWTVEASRDNNYVDAGATCSDMVDGNISQDVEVSGDVVNMAAVGTYMINYNCEDSAGQVAVQATRTVVVQDRTCPTCIIPGGNAKITVEASFPYTEEPSTCTDTLDGAMPNAHVYNTVNVEQTGEYVLTYSVTDKNGNGNSNKLCKVGGDASSTATASATHFTKTVIVEDTMIPIISLKYRGTNLVGMMAESSTTTVNGWVIGAVASAVSGVALLGYAATRKATVATSVPV